MTLHYSPAEVAALPPAEFGFPGPLRDQLVAAILDGSKTSTTGLVIDYAVCGEALPRVGERSAVIDSHSRPAAVLEVTAVDVCALGHVDLQHAVDEGEGYTSLAQWRADHEAYWHSTQMRAALECPDFTVDDQTQVVLERFRLIGIVER
ncbi:ASCH domain-containing protein [Arthrobacter sp. H14-L1]|uniref:ASCH domain-containing protein n=1 Tax=Arthrobacter sp. H14-L1 TaxID=2996697 RepID=UPI002271EEDF|nr:ASCH domain-containing protein [Arthrobacter sp. H14-L1]MCY0904620.1 ASCH domain-containing protein [Arthrobacter sp. H14-L1]